MYGFILPVENGATDPTITAPGAIVVIDLATLQLLLQVGSAQFGKAHGMDDVEVNNPRAISAGYDFQLLGEKGWFQIFRLKANIGI